MALARRNASISEFWFLAKTRFLVLKRALLLPVGRSLTQVAVVLVILDRLGLIGGEPWLEVHLDALSVQSTLFHGRVMSWWSSLRQYMHFIKRVESRG